MQVAVISLLGFLAVWGLLFFVNILLAPSRLDAQKEVALSESRAEVLTLKGALARKHPHDEHKDNQIREWMRDYTEQDRAFLQWLLDAGEKRHLEIQSTHGIEALAKIERSSHLIASHYVDVKGRSDRRSRINPNYEAALRDFLYPAT